MIAFFAENATAFWFVLLIIFSVAEAATVSLVSIWFALGALGAFIAKLLSASFPAQVTVFIIVSLISLLATRPLVNKLHTKNIQSTNADRCLGMDAVVIEEIDNLNSKGQVKVNGNVWTARSENNQIIPKGSIVRAVRIDGVKLIVKAEKE